MKCINCKYNMTPKRVELGENIICVSITNDKGLVKSTSGCDKGKKI